MQARSYRVVLPLAAATLCGVGIAAVSARARGDLQTTIDLTTRGVRTEESRLADVVADALRSSASTDLAFVAASSFDEVTLRRGTLSADAVLKAVSFKDDPVMVVKLTGAQVRKALEHSVALYPQGHSAFLQVSGMQATIDPRAPKGERVVQIRVGSSPIVDSRTYTVAMPGPLANGGLTYFNYWEKKDIDQERSGQRTVQEAVTTYLASRRSVGDGAEDRLVFKK